MLDTLGDPVVAANSANQIVYVNRELERLLGWPWNELAGRPILTIIPARLHDAHLAGFQRYLDTRVPHVIGSPIRMPALHRDGSEIDIELSLSALTFPNGEPLFVASLRDLRGRAELERQLLVTRYLRSAAAAAARLTSRLDVQHLLQTVVEMQVSDFDAALARIWLYDEQHGVLTLRASAGLSTRTAESSRARMEVASSPAKIAEVARTQRSFVRNGLDADPNFDQEWVRRERIASVAAFPLARAGSLRGVLIHFSRLPLPEEVVEVLATFCAIATTVLEDVELFHNEQAARAEAERARERFAFLAEVSRVLASSLDYGTTLTNVARLAVASLADWCTVHIVEPSGAVRQLVVAHADPAKVEMAAEIEKRFPFDPQATGGVANVLRSGISEIVPEITNQMIVEAMTDGELRRILLDLQLCSSMIVPLIARGRIVGAMTFLAAESGRHYTDEDLALAEDLARRAATAVDNARLHAEVQESIRTRDEFLSSVSHDLKNPLTSLKGHAQLLQRRVRRMDIEEASRLAEGLESIVATTTRMNRIINDLVDFAHLRAGSPLELRREATDLVALARELLDDQKDLTHRHRIVLDARPESLVGNVDRTRVERVLTNLLSNAIKYSPDGGTVTVTIRSETGEAGPVALISVHDEGIGIPLSDLPHVFERFHRASNVGTIAGTGIGLAGAKQIVDQHSGVISVGSHPGEGTTFTVRLPLDQ